MRLPVASVVFVSGAPTKVGMSECKVFEGKYYPEQNAVERRRGDFLQTEGTDLAAA